MLRLSGHSRQFELGSRHACLERAYVSEFHDERLDAVHFRDVDYDADFVGHLSKSVPVGGVNTKTDSITDLHVFFSADCKTVIWS